MRTCFFIGDRQTPDSLLPLLETEVERHRQTYDVRRFVVGGYGRFDALAAQAVKRLKQHCPEVTLLLLRPYHPTERPIPLPEGFDGSLYPPGMEAVPRRAAIVRANRYMVEHCHFLIAYAPNPIGSAGRLTAYAAGRDRRDLLHITILPEAAASSR